MALAIFQSYMWQAVTMGGLDLGRFPHLESTGGWLLSGWGNCGLLGQGLDCRLSAPISSSFKASSRQEFMLHSSKKVVVVNMFPVVWEEMVSVFEMIA